MITAAEVLSMMRERLYKPLTEEELVAELAFDKAAAGKLGRLLAELEQEGQIVRTRYGRLGVPEKMNLVVGRLQGSERGFAFLISPERQEDVFIAASNMGGAMHGDRVIARFLPRPAGGRSTEGEVIRILQRAHTRVVGRFEGGEHVGFCRPDERRLGPDIVIAHGSTAGARTGDLVVVRITRYPDGRGHPATGEVEEVLGPRGAPGVDILAVMRQFDLPDDFPGAVKEQISRMRLDLSPEDLAGRRDLRSLPVITIDVATAQDLDDAISLEKNEAGNFLLGVHIADVSHYVPGGSPLDREARQRGTSVYLLDRVVPMLPLDLSNGICSLMPRVDRLTLSVFMEIDGEGNMLKHEIAESVICSRERLTYDTVNEILLNEASALGEQYAAHLEQLTLMHELHDLLAEKRRQRGAIDFDLQEAQIILDSEGRVQDIVPRSATLADKIIEEFMVLANMTVAEHYFWLESPFVYRVHEQPSPTKLEELAFFLGAFGLRFKGRLDNIRPKNLQTLLAQVSGRREEKLIQRVLLRSMMRARYAADCLGHFGLALKHYCHFTAPIRRYPDLAIHRIIKENLHKRQMSAKHREALEAFVDKASRESSIREQVAVEAERMIVDIKKIEFMAGKEGEVYDALISGVTNFGFFAELDNTVEGLVHVSSLDDDYYEFDERTYALVGRQTRRRFRLGDTVRVQVMRVSVEERRIHFEVAPSVAERPSGREDNAKRNKDRRKLKSPSRV